ncbi:MAG: methyltransferase domain-containing protein [Anaerolineales bacterium]|nr:methyltransferase domain-containing protein [Anaerolineales bacterium]
MAITFDANYYAHGCGRPYQRDGLWLAQFGAVADRIVRDLEPQSVLDVGCAYGLLVETLRERGVDAYGIDVSEYAISQAAPVVQPYVHVGSAVEPFGRTYDLIVTIEVLEHLPPEQAEPAIANICRHTDDVLFSSSPLDYSEITHFNVQPPEIWARHFANQGFYRDVDFDASFITPWAARFRRLSGPVANIVTAYERRFWQLQQASQARRQLNVQQRNELAQHEFNNRELAAEVAQLREQVERLRSQNQELQADRINLQALEYSFGGRMLRKAQGMRAALAPPQSMRDQVLDDFLQRFILRRKQIGPAQPGIPLSVTPIEPRAPLAPHTAAVDIVICVHNALHDVESCLESVAAHTNAPYHLILIDDGSDAPTRDFLAQYAASHAVTLVRNEQAGGYGRAAAQGLHLHRTLHPFA